MRHRVLILGGGTAGTLAANRLARSAGAGDLEVTVVDADDRHVYQPGLLLVPFGEARPRDLVRSRRRQLHGDVHFVEATVDHVDTAAATVTLAGGDVLGYDVLVVASGSRLVPEETEGMAGPGWLERVFTFYELESASALAGALARFERGRIVVAVMDLPFKCPVAPLEFSFLADAFFRRRGLRHRIELTYVTPLDGAFTKPVAAAKLGGMLEARGIDVVTEFTTGEVVGAADDAGGPRLVSYDGREQPFDLAVVVPLHAGAEFVTRSEGLGDPLGFVSCDPHTLQSTAAPNVFAIGDAADVPTSKAGSVAHFEGEVLLENIRRHLAGEPLVATFDGHTNCFVESGHGKALLIDFDYEHEPMPGRFPAALGPLGLPLMAESRACHLAKRAFSSFYWHVLLPGFDVPGMDRHDGHGVPRDPLPAVAGHKED